MLNSLVEFSARIFQHRKIQKLKNQEQDDTNVEAEVVAHESDDDDCLFVKGLI